MHFKIRTVRDNFISDEVNYYYVDQNGGDTDSRRGLYVYYKKIWF